MASEEQNGNDRVSAAATPSSVTISSLIDRPVVSFAGGQRVGTTTDVFVGADGKTVTHLELAYARGEAIPRIVTFDAVRRIGRDVILLHRLPKQITASGIQLEEPEDEENGSAALPDDLLGVRDLRKLEVLAHDGRNLGSLRDVVFNPEDRSVLHYVVTAGRVQDFLQGEFHVPVDAVEVFGHDYVILTDNAVDLIQQGRPGVRDTVDELRGRFDSIVGDTLTQGRSLLERVQKGVQESGYGSDLVRENLGRLGSRLSEARDGLSDAWQNWQRKARGAQQEAETLVGEREVDFLAGKVAGKTVEAEDGTVIVEEGQEIDHAIVASARKHKRLYPLFLSAAMTEVREQLKEVEETTEELEDTSTNE